MCIFSFCFKMTYRVKQSGSQCTSVLIVPKKHELNKMMQKLNAYFSPDGRCILRGCHQYALTRTWHAKSNFSAWSGGQTSLHLGRGNRRARTSCKYAASMQLWSHLYPAIESPAYSHSAFTLTLSSLSLYTACYVCTYLRTFICDTCDLK